MLRCARYSSIPEVTLNSQGLLALTLPTAMEQPLLALQREIFRELDLPSALALPPLLPLLWTASPLPLESVRAVARASTVSFRLTGSAPELRSREIILPLEIARRRGQASSTTVLERLREAARKESRRNTPAIGATSVPPPFPLIEAIRLASIPPPATPSDRGRPNVEQALADLPVVPIEAESEAVTVVSFRFTRGVEGEWWRHLNFEAVAERRVTVRD